MNFSGKHQGQGRRGLKEQRAKANGAEGEGQGQVGLFMKGNCYFPEDQHLGN